MCRLIGETFDIDGLHVEVIDAERRRVRKVRMTRARGARARRRAAARSGRWAPATDVKAGFVSLIGRPNAGKSSLLNRIVGAKLAIVSDKPQTTRRRILGVKNYGDGQVVFVDTPGIHRPLHRMNVRMVGTAVETLSEVDVVGVVVDVSESPGAGLRYLLDLVKDARPKVVLILNKIDLIKKHKMLPIIDHLSRERDWEAIVPVSAATRRQRRAPRGGSPERLAGRRAVISRGLPDRSSRTRHGGGDGARAGAPVDPR